MEDRLRGRDSPKTWGKTGAALFDTSRLGMEPFVYAAADVTALFGDLQVVLAIDE